MIKRRLLRALEGAGIALHEIEPAVLVYPKDGPLSGDCNHSDPLVPVYWLSDEIGPSVERAIARYQDTGAPPHSGSAIQARPGGPGGRP